MLAGQLVRAAQPPPPASVVLPNMPPPTPCDQRVTYLSTSDPTLRELPDALHHCPKQRSAPGVDGVTYQMLRNLGVSQLPPLLWLFNRICRAGALPPTMLVGLISLTLKVSKPFTNPGSYRTVQLTSAAGKWMECIVLAPLGRIT